jgi:hypothetical protein
MSEYKRTGDRNLLYVEAAGGVIRQYLKIFVFGEHMDQYLDAKEVNSNRDVWYIFPLRVMLIGETLFLLRSCDGFDLLCQRLRQQRDLRSAFYEARATRQFLEAGFNIHIRKITQTLGEDFDFVATQGDLEVNVEATALKEKEFYEETAYNALDRKRKQISPHKPGVIFCLFPSSWENTGLDINQWMDKLAARFLRTTRRVNVLVCQMERHIDISLDKSKGEMVTISKSYFNEDPRHSADLGFLFEDGMPRHEQEALMSGMKNPMTAADLAQRLRVSEFYRWVDHLVP